MENKPNIDVMVADASHEAYVDTILETIVKVGVHIATIDCYYSITRIDNHIERPATCRSTTLGICAQLLALGGILGDDDGGVVNNLMITLEVHTEERRHRTVGIGGHIHQHKDRRRHTLQADRYLLADSLAAQRRATAEFLIAHRHLTRGHIAIDLSLEEVVYHGAVHALPLLNRREAQRLGTILLDLDTRRLRRDRQSDKQCSKKG